MGDLFQSNMSPQGKQKREGIAALAFSLYGGSSGVRTLGLGIKSPLLCQLS